MIFYILSDGQLDLLFSVLGVWLWLGLEGDVNIMGPWLFMHTVILRGRNSSGYYLLKNPKTQTKPIPNPNANTITNPNPISLTLITCHYITTTNVLLRH